MAVVDASAPPHEISFYAFLPPCRSFTCASNAETSAATKVSHKYLAKGDLLRRRTLSFAAGLVLVQLGPAKERQLVREDGHEAHLGEGTAKRLEEGGLQRASVKEDRLCKIAEGRSYIG